MIHTKHNATTFDDALLKEAHGLEWLQRFLPADKVSVPAVFSVDAQSLSMTAIAGRGHCDDELAARLGEGLAAMHAVEQAWFGFDEDNYIGLNPQSNSPADSWGEFFLHQRLWLQVNMMACGSERDAFSEILERQGQRLVDYLDTHCTAPSLVHGDLWSGNVLCDGARVWLIDPAVHFADREVDIAMTEMFGGFAEAFYRSYHSALPLSTEYPRKRSLYNLYHALNHYNLFGRAYRSRCEHGFDVLDSL